MSTRLNMAPAGQGLCQSATAGIFGPCVGRHYESLLFFLLQKKNVAVCLLTLPQIERFSDHTRVTMIIINSIPIFISILIPFQYDHHY